MLRPLSESKRPSHRPAPSSRSLREIWTCFTVFLVPARLCGPNSRLGLHPRCLLNVDTYDFLALQQKLSLPSSRNPVLTTNKLHWCLGQSSTRLTDLESDGSFCLSFLVSAQTASLFHAGQICLAEWMSLAVIRIILFKRVKLMALWLPSGVSSRRLAVRMEEIVRQAVRCGVQSVSNDQDTWPEVPSIVWNILSCLGKMFFSSSFQHVTWGLLNIWE